MRLSDGDSRTFDEFLPAAAGGREDVVPPAGTAVQKSLTVLQKGAGGQRDRPQLERAHRFADTLASCEAVDLWLQVNPGCDDDRMFTVITEPSVHSSVSRPGCASRIDLFCGPMDLVPAVASCHVCFDRCGSDHRPLILDLDMSKLALA